MKIIDLTHPIVDEMRVYYPWHPHTQLVKTASYQEHKCVVTRITIGSHTGTHIDAPSHVFEGMPTLDHYDLRLWYTDVQVLDFTPRASRKEITEDEVRARYHRKGLGVLLKTGWDVHFGREDYYQTYPPLSNQAAEYLAQMEIPVMASDTPYTLDVHHILLEKRIPLITNLNNTGQLREGVIKLITAPLLIKDGDGAPARVLALIE